MSEEIWKEINPVTADLLKGKQEIQQLRVRVRELEDGIKKHAGASVSNIISEADLELWALLEGGLND